MKLPDFLEELNQRSWIILLANALVDSRQPNDDLNHQLVHNELAHQVCENGPQVSLTTLDVLQKLTVCMQFGH